MRASAMSGVGLQAFYRRVSASTIWRLGFKQSSLHHIARDLRYRPYNAFSRSRFTDMLCSPLVFTSR